MPGVQKSRVVVAGVGLVTPLGLDVASTWRNMLAGASGVSAITAFDASGLGTQIAGSIRADQPYVSRFLRRATNGRREAFAFRAVDEAMMSAGLLEQGLGRGSLGIFTGCEAEQTNDFRIFSAYEDDRASDAARRHIHQLGTRQPDATARTILHTVPRTKLLFNYTMACAAGAVAVHEALRWLRRGAIDRALVLAVDTPVNVSAVHGFEELGALSSCNEAPERASRPFDRDRDGFVLSEGAGVLILETERFAQCREHRGSGYLLGGGMTNNQYHITRTPASGEHAARAMRMAIEDAGLAPSDIDYINAHATSTDLGDSSEVTAIMSAFDSPPPTSSTKSMTGHMVAASGVVEMIVALMAVREGRLPPTINHEEHAAESSLDFVPNISRAARVRNALSNSFGFGGTNVALVVGGLDR